MVGPPLSLERTPEGGASVSPLLSTDNAYNERARAQHTTQTSKKPKGLREPAREELRGGGVGGHHRGPGQSTARWPALSSAAAVHWWREEAKEWLMGRRSI